MRSTLLVLAAATFGAIAPTGTAQVTRIEAIPTPTRLRMGEGLRDVFCFVADVNGLGREVWRSDGTAAGTSMVINLDGTSGNSISSNLVRMGAHVYFGGVSPGIGAELFRSDGTAAGTELVAETWPGPASGEPETMIVAHGLIFLVAQGPGLGRELWRTDGSDTGTFLLRDIRPGGSSTPHGFVEADDVLYFVADGPSFGQEIWQTDGTPAGTVLAADTRPGGLGSFPFPVAALGRELVFGANTSAGNGIWITDDSSPQGARRLADGSVGGAGVDLGGVILFIASDLQAGRELWRTDGTPAGTRRVMDLNPGRSTGVYQIGGVLGGAALMSADDGTTGAELWRTDGTPAGTWLVRDLEAGPAGAGASSMTTSFSSRYAYFRADTSKTGAELWRTDGTEAGTTLVADIRPGQESSNPFFLGAAAGKIFYSAYDGSAYLQLVDAGATARPVGIGCGEPGRVPSLGADDPVLGALTTIRGGNSVAGAAGYVLASGLATPVWTPGIACEIFFDPFQFVVLAPFTTTGSDWSVPLPIPALPALTGLTLTIQAILAPTPSVYGFDLTNGVELTFGR